MTLEVLEQYGIIKQEIKELELKINILHQENKDVVADSVKGSTSEYPYVSHIISIAGYPNDIKTLSKIKKLEVIRRNRLARLIAVELAIEEYIDSLTDSLLRQIITYRFIEGFSWIKVSRMIGHKTQDEQYPRQILNRHFKKCTICTDNAC